jgi:hypothetical protein
VTWARATLLRGASSGSVWEVDSKYPQARVVVGSASNAGWVVTGPGISPFHVELYWDGSTLYVSDPQAAGDVRLNGQPVHAWTQVQGRAQLVFGRAIMDLETSVVEPSVVMLNPTTAPRISAPLMGEATRVQNVDEPFEAESTRVQPAHEEMAPSRSVPPRAPPPPPGHPGPRAVPPPPQREAQETLAVPVEGMAERPRLGAESAPIGQDATRMIDGAAMFAAGKPSVTVSQGVAPVIAGSAFIAKQPVGFAPPAGTPSFAPQQPNFGGQPQPGFGQPQPGFGQPAPMMAASPATQPAIAAPPPMATGQFVPPPSHNEAGPTDAKSGSIPPRTRILLLLFIVGAGLSIGFQQYRVRQANAFAAEVAARQRAAQAAALAAQAGQPAVPGQPGVPAQPGVSGQPGVPAIPQPAPATAWVNPSTFVPVLETTYLVDAGFPRTPDSVAADLVGEGRQEDALVQYEALHAAHPERPEYGVMCEVLRRQILQRCVNGRRWDGTLCTQ